MTYRLAAFTLAALFSFAPLTWCQMPSSNTQSAPASRGFDGAADEALAIMGARARQMNVNGVAVVAYFPGETVQAWSSKMIVVGKLKTDPTATDKGSNLLGIAYAKACEMADTLKDSGTAGRPPLTGEFGWNGGVIEKVNGGYVIAAFSGGKSEEDVSISRQGLTRLKAAF